MELLKKVTLEINKEVNRNIKAKQNDTARYLLFTIVDNGVPFSLQGKEVKIFAVKPDGKLVYNACQITNSTNGETKLNLTSQMLAVPGTLKSELVISEGNNILSTIPFEIEVIKSLRDDRAIESTNEFSALTNGLSKLDEWDNLFKETSGKIEEKYTERLNNVSSQFSDGMNKLNDLENVKADKNSTYSKSDVYNKAQIDEKVWTMQNLGQDVKEAMTGGSVAVVGVDAVDNVNVKNDSLREEKMAYIPQRNFLTNGIEMYATDYEEYFDIRILSDNSIFYYYDSYGKKIRDFNVTTKQYNLANYNSLIWDLGENSLKIIPDGQNLPAKHVKLLHNSVDFLDGGVLLDYVNNYDKEHLYKSENSFCYFEDPLSFYISTKGKYIKKVWFKWNGNITLREVNRLISSKSYNDISSNLAVSNSLNGNKNCITLEDGECFVYKYSTNDFYICKWQEYDYKQHILLLRNTDGNAIDGLFINHINNNIKLDTEINFKKIPSHFDNYIESKKIAVINNQNENTVCLAHISDIHTTEYTGYNILQGINVLNEFANTLGIQAIINTGDNIMYENNKTDSISNSMRLQERISNKSILLNSIGNHDSNGWNDSEIQSYDTIINNKELYAIHGLKLNDHVIWGDKLGMYYYYDVPNSNVRIITLNSCDVPYIRLEDGNIKYNPNFIYNYSQKQIDFLINTLKNSGDKHIVINTHIPLLNESEGMVANVTMPNNNECVLGVLKAFKEGSSYTYSNDKEDFEVSVNCNFLTSGTIIGVFCGHIHYDCLIKKDGINHISINCDLMDKWTDSQPDRIFNTSSQFCFDILTINIKNKEVKMTRVGAGDNRSFNY
ncbi:BppU family phage baseplate upper protein [Clostridium baratii]|uniref:BppU family phage baseplate upper protein n=1 Tax=Clostridium baratii TaxID=1561 RepID=UPI0030CAAA3C